MIDNSKVSEMMATFRGMNEAERCAFLYLAAQVEVAPPAPAKRKPGRPLGGGKRRLGKSVAEIPAASGVESLTRPA